jgi:hypothetical protein
MGWLAIISVKSGDCAPLDQVADNRIVDLRCENKQLLEEFRTHEARIQKQQRVDELASATPVRASSVTFCRMRDSRHSHRLGPPYAGTHRADWFSRPIDCVGRDFDIWFDGEQIMEAENSWCDAENRSVARFICEHQPSAFSISICAAGFAVTTRAVCASFPHG